MLYALKASYNITGNLNDFNFRNNDNFRETTLKESVLKIRLFPFTLSGKQNCFRVSKEEELTLNICGNIKGGAKILICIELLVLCLW